MRAPAGSVQTGGGWGWGTEYRVHQGRGLHPGAQLRDQRRGEEGSWLLGAHGDVPWAGDLEEAYVALQSISLESGDQSPEGGARGEQDGGGGRRLTWTTLSKGCVVSWYKFSSKT